MEHKELKNANKCGTLRNALQAALDQAETGKGNIRHGNGQAFEKQPMQVISNMLDSDAGMAFQAIKKIHEGRGMADKNARVTEYLGAINYIAGMVVYEWSKID